MENDICAQHVRKVNLFVLGNIETNDALRFEQEWVLQVQMARVLLLLLLLVGI